MRAAVAALLIAAVGLFAAEAQAEEVKITQDVSFVELTVGGAGLLIERNQDTGHRLDNDFAKTSRPCPPFCIHPMKAADGVETVGELELIEFLKDKVEPGDGLLVDARIPEWFEKGSIPGAVNIPFTLLSAEDNAYLDDILAALGGVKSEENWDFSEAKELMLYCNGPWCDQSPRAIQNLVSVGYPAEKLFYYRGGMQSWQLLGLTVN